MWLRIFMTGFGATVNVAKPKKGHTVAIFGLGAVGLAVSIYHAIRFLFTGLLRREFHDID